MKIYNRDHEYQKWWKKPKDNNSKRKRKKIKKDKITHMNLTKLRYLRAELHNLKMKVKDGTIPEFNRSNYDKYLEYYDKNDINKSIWIDLELTKIEEGINKIKEKEANNVKKTRRD